MSLQNQQQNNIAQFPSCRTRTRPTFAMKDFKSRLQKKKNTFSCTAFSMIPKMGQNHRGHIGCSTKTKITAVYGLLLKHDSGTAVVSSKCQQISSSCIMAKQNFNLNLTPSQSHRSISTKMTDPGNTKSRKSSTAFTPSAPSSTPSQNHIPVMHMDQHLLLWQQTSGFAGQASLARIGCTI